MLIFVVPHKNLWAQSALANTPSPVQAWNFSSQTGPGVTF